MNQFFNIVQKFKAKLFNDVVKILNSEQIEFWLDYDTLLGIWSRIQDRDLSFEPNIYLSINHKNSNDLKKALTKLNFLYRVQYINNGSSKKWVDDNTVAVRIFNSWKKTINSFKVIISIKYEDITEYRWVDNRNCKSISNNYYNDLDSINFDSKSYKIPSHTDEYLNNIFGDWKNIPVNWMRQINDGTLATEESLKQTDEIQIQNNRNREKIKLQDSNNHSRMKEMLLFTIDKLQENNIPFWIEAGTLLGIYRDGDLIKWDYDADIGIPSEYSNKAAKLWKEFFPKYIVRKRSIDSRWIPENTRVVKIKTTWEQLKQVNFHIDLFCVYKVDDMYRWVDSGVLKHVNTKYYDSLDTINWEGREVPIPYHTEEYLQLRYGDWKTPNQNYNAALHDGAIAERGF